jgi:hypothetical protein
MFDYYPPTAKNIRRYRQRISEDEKFLNRERERAVERFTEMDGTIRDVCEKSLAFELLDLMYERGEVSKERTGLKGVECPACDVYTFKLTTPKNQNPISINMSDTVAPLPTDENSDMILNSREVAALRHYMQLVRDGAKISVINIPGTIGPVFRLTRQEADTLVGKARLLGFQ